MPQTTKFARYKETGFNIPTKKVEIYSLLFAQHDYPPLPAYEEPELSPKVNQVMAREYPLVLTNAKLRYFLHARQRAVPDLRKRVPHPFLEMNKENAHVYDAAEDEWVYLETPKGRVKL